MKPVPGVAVPGVAKSHPSRVRGLKRAHITNCERFCTVAPFTGAWIETVLLPIIIRAGLVAPFTGAWIETVSYARCITARYVAPFTGAWIETSKSSDVNILSYVAPFTGAWIETASSLTSPHVGSSRTLHGCVD